MKALLVALLTLSATRAGFAQQPVDYRFDEVKRNVLLTNASRAGVKVTAGQHGHGGDKVQTGVFAYALISSERYRAKFELYGSTDVQLSTGAPGVILTLERGRLHAMFDKITGSEPRVVQTPGALLAVRGTQYDVSVDARGGTDLKVYEGTVELRADSAREPLFVHAGEGATFSRREPPVLRQVPIRRDNPDRRTGDKPPEGAGRNGQPGQGGNGQPGNGDDRPQPGDAGRGRPPAGSPPGNPPGGNTPPPTPPPAAGRKP